MTPQALTWLVVGLFVAQLAYWIVFRLVNLDEGWYLWAGQEVYRGRLLYRDFAYTQTPLLPYIYGPVQLLFGNGLYVGRIVTALFGLLAALLSAATARRLAGPWAGLFALLFLATTFLAVTAFTFTATYGLAACLLALAFYLALRLAPGTRRTALVAVFLALAVAVRLSTVVVFLPLGLYVILTSPRRWRAALTLAGVAALALGLLLGPFLLLSGEVMLYDILGFHTDRNTPSWHQAMVQDKLWETVRDLPVPVIGYLAAAAALAWNIARGGRTAWRIYGFEVALAASVFLLFLTHFIPRTTMSYYNTLQAPLVAVLVGALLARLLRRSRWLTVALLAILLAAQVVTQARAVRFYGLNTWPQSQVETVRTAAQALRNLAPDGQQVLTFNLHLALEAGLDVPDGFEMSIFSYRPTWSDEQALRYRVINNAGLLAALEQGADAVALTRFDQDLLYGERDTLFDALYRNYRLASVVPGFGPLGDELQIFLPPQQTVPATTTPLDRSFDQGIRLRGYELAGANTRPGDTLTLALYWQAEQPVQQPFTVFTHLLDTNETVVVGQDNPPCRGACPTTTWQPGEVIRDEYTWRLPETLSAGRYRIQVGLYEPQTLARLSVLGAGGATIGDRLILATLDCQPGAGDRVQCALHPAAGLP
ncbi:MAG TPA: glycosyltransferase family 39 protein [Anaerolineae bacterium]|nr:glycosyltransferase family 39 protein [Anaerolineae bacterium]